MEKSQYNLCVEVLRRFYKAGLLNDFILIGSWAMVFYKEQFKDWPRLNKFVLMTRDMDFLIDSVHKIKQKVEDFKVTLPHPARFALHKLIVAQRRKNKDKAQKDNMMALEILNDLMEVGEKESIQLAYSDLNTQWQKWVIAGLESLKQEVILSELKKGNS